MHSCTRLAGLEHLERHEAVERREGGVAQVVASGVGGVHTRRALVLDGRDDALALERLASREMASGLRGYLTVLEYVKVALELRGEVLFEELPRSLGGAFDGVAGVFIHQGPGWSA